MNLRVTVALLAVLVALGGYVYFGDASGGQASAPAGAAGKEKPIDQSLEVWSITDRDVQRISVRRADQVTELEKDADGNWTLQPSGEPADRLRVSGVLSRLASLRGTRRFDQPASLADYGLDAPATVVTLRQADATELTLLLGSKAPAEAGTYAKRGDDAAVFVVSNALVQDLDRLVTEPPRAVPTSAPTPVEATPTP